VAEFPTTQSVVRQSEHLPTATEAFEAPQIAARLAMMGGVYNTVFLVSISFATLARKRRMRRWSTSLAILLPLNLGREPLPSNDIQGLREHPCFTEYGLAAFL
jgi:hypothetical protein